MFRMIFNPLPMPFSFLFFLFLLHLQRLSAVPFAPGPGKNCRHFCPSCPQLLAHSLTPPSARQWHGNSSALRRPRSRNIKRLRSIIGLSVLWKYCVSLFVSFLCLSPTLPPAPSIPSFPSVASNSSHMFRHCQACGEVHFSNGSFAQIPLLHCLVFADMREVRCVYFFVLVGFNLFILVLIILGFIRIPGRLCCSTWCFGPLLTFFFVFVPSFLPPFLYILSPGIKTGTLKKKKKTDILVV